MSQTSGETVLIVIPFAGTLEELVSTAEAWQDLEDSAGRVVGIVLVENAPEPQNPEVGPVTVLGASHHGSSYYARNLGAAYRPSDWILFVDADCMPDPALVNEYFATSWDDHVGAAVGGIRPADGDSLVARYSGARAILDPDQASSLKEGASAVTANLLVRRAAFEACGGFCEGIRSGGDIDFSWRLQERGWTIAEQRSAGVQHAHRETVRDLVKQYRRYGAGYGWLRRRYGALDSERFRGTHPILGGIRATMRSIASAFAALAHGEKSEALYSLLDAVSAAAWVRGVCDDNRPRWRASAATDEGASGVVDAVLEIDGVSEVRGRPFAPFAATTRGSLVRYWEDDGYGERAYAALRIAPQLVARGRLAALVTLLRRGRDLELFPVVRRCNAAASVVARNLDDEATVSIARASVRNLVPQNPST